MQFRMRITSGMAAMAVLGILGVGCTVRVAMVENIDYSFNTSCATHCVDLNRGKTEEVIDIYFVDCLAVPGQLTSETASCMQQRLSGHFDFNLPAATLSWNAAVQYHADQLAAALDVLDAAPALCLRVLNKTTSVEFGTLACSLSGT